MKAIQYLQEADNLLHKIEVSGESVFLMADARRILKLAFDDIKKQPKDEAKEE